MIEEDIIYVPSDYCHKMGCGEKVDNPFDFCDIHKEKMLEKE